MYLPECFKTCYLLHYTLISAFDIAENFKMLWLMEFSKNEVWTEMFISGMCYSIVFEEESLIPAYLMALLISMLPSCVLWKNTFLGNAGNYIVNWTGYSFFCCLRLSSQSVQLGLDFVGMWQRIYVLISSTPVDYPVRNRSSGEFGSVFCQWLRYI